MAKKVLENKIPYEMTTAGGNKMKLIYVSHPYSGEEVKNRSKSTEIVAKLADMYPYIVFVNPLNAMRHIKQTKLTYDDTLALCIGLLSVCDGIIMTGEWKKSNGCNMEREFALSRGMAVWDGEDNFSDEETMHNDCCGTHACCERCICRKCVHRLACWNCNDCTRDKGKENAIGFTGEKMWQPECSRFRKKN